MELTPDPVWPFHFWWGCSFHKLVAGIVLDWYLTEATVAFKPHGNCLGALELGSSRNLQFPHFTKEKMPWCPCPFKKKQSIQVQLFILELFIVEQVIVLTSGWYWQQYAEVNFICLECFPVFASVADWYTYIQVDFSAILYIVDRWSYLDMIRSITGALYSFFFSQNFDIFSRST